MNAAGAMKDDPIPANRLAEAGVWIARLHGDDRNPALEAGFRQWLKSHPLNARAFELTTEVWEDSQNLRRVVPFAHDVSKAGEERGRFRLPLVAAAAAVAILAIAAAIVHVRREGVATDVGEQRLLTLEDGSRVFLNTATHVIVRYDQNMRKIELKSGEALFDVAKRPNRPFIVDAGDRQVTALATSFVIRRDARNLAVTLVEGKVAVAPLPASTMTSNLELRRDTFTLNPGQRLTFSNGKTAQLDTPSLEKTIAWRRGQVVLDDTRLSSAVTEMNRYSSAKLVIDDPGAANLLVNGLFQAGDSVSFANAVAQTYGLRVAERSGLIVLEGLPGPSLSDPQ